MQMRRRTIKAAAGRYIFKRSAWVNTGPNGPTMVYLSWLQLYARTPAFSLCAASRRGAARRSSRGGEAPGRFEVQPVYTSSAQRNLAGVYGGYTARTRSTGRGPSISHSIRSLASRLASSSPDATPMILGSPIALAGRAEFWCTRRVEVNVDSSG